MDWFVHDSNSMVYKALDLFEPTVDAGFGNMLQFSTMNRVSKFN